MGGTPFDGVGGLPTFVQWRDALQAVRQSALAHLATAMLRNVGRALGGVLPGANRAELVGR